MKSKSVFLAFMVVLAIALPSLGQEDKLGKVEFVELVQPGGAGEVPARRGDAALVLLFRGGKGLRGGRRGRQFLRDRGLGIRLDPDVEPAPGNRRLAQERAAGAGRDRQGPARWARRPSASAITSEAVAAYYEDFANRHRARAPARARQGLRGARGEIPGRRRGADLLRAVPRGDAAASDQIVLRVAQGRRDPREAVRQASRTIPASRTT